MRVLVLVAVLSLALPAIGGEAPSRLVLGTGKTIENVTTRINDGMVWVTFPDGHMEAYSTEDVDLEASGLIAKKDTTGAEKPDSRSEMTRIADAKSSSETTSAFTITDADVEHVVPDAPEDENGADKEEQGPLVVTGILHSVVNGRVNVKGTVTNTTSNPISAITVAVVAIGFDGAVVGNGNARLNRPLGPKKGTEFSLMMAGSTDFQEIKARARGTSSDPASNRNTRPSQNPHARQAPRGKEH